MVLQLGRWVLHTACRQLAQWAQRPGLAELALSVNVSPLQFQQPQLCRMWSRPWPRTACAPTA
jgi:EAL domain-containing protein (putative c-di-GMP-specific phosphodiesterase class I)